MRAYRQATKEQKRLYDKQYTKDNREQIKQTKAKWLAANADLLRSIRTAYAARRRAQIKEGDSTSTIHAWVKKQRLVCRWCDADCSDGYHVDHVHPLSRGGRHVIGNLCIACPPCNIKKNAKALDDWLAELQRHRCDVGMLEPA